ELDPQDREASGRLTTLFEASGRHTDLAVLQRQRAESANPEERPAALLALAAAQERAGQLDDAAQTLLGLFAIKPDVEVLAALDPLHESLGDLTQAYAGRLRLVREGPSDPDARSELERLARAAHHEEELVESYDELIEGGQLEQGTALALRAATAKLYADEL